MNKAELQNVLVDLIEPVLTDAIEKVIRKIELKNSEPEVHDRIFIDEAAEILGIKKATLYIKCGQKSGKDCKNPPPFTKRGKRLYFSRRELMEYIRQGRK